MTPDIRVPAAESYPTFWDDAPPAQAVAPQPEDDAYAAFVNLTEDELPDSDDAGDGPDAD